MDVTENRSPVSRIVGAVVPMAVDSIDVDALIDRLDVDALMARVDVDALLTRIDIDALLARIDIEGLLGRIDLQALIGRIDLNSLIGEVDLNAVMADLDVKALVDKAGIEQIVAEASTGIFARTLDLARRQLVGLDIIIMGAVDRLFHRGPVRLAEVDSHSATGRPAGPISRVLAFSFDLFLVSAIFSLVTAFATSMVELFTGDTVKPTHGAAPILWAVAYFGWFGFYLWASVEIAGKTPGKALLGLRVVGLDGEPLGPGRALVRTLVFPFSFILGLGFIPAITRRDRRALHELVAGCQEIVDWGDRDAALPGALESWIDRKRQKELAAGAPPVDDPAPATSEPDPVSAAAEPAPAPAPAPEVEPAPAPASAPSEARADADTVAETVAEAPSPSPVVVATTLVRTEVVDVPVDDEAATDEVAADDAASPETSGDYWAS